MNRNHTNVRLKKKRRPFSTIMMERTSNSIVLYALAVGMSGEDLVEIPCCDVEDDGNENIAIGLVIELVHAIAQRILAGISRQAVR